MTITVGDFMVSRGGSLLPGSFPNEKFELYSIAAHDRGGPEITRGSEIGSSKQLVQPGDVMISKIIPHIRRVRIVGEFTGRRQIASGEWIALRGTGFLPEYLRHFLLSDVFHMQFMNTVAGVGGSLVRARPAQVKSIQIPLPLLKEQRRIAAILDQADAVRAKRRQGLTHLDKLENSAFRLRFGTPMVVSRLPRRRLGELARIVRGASPRPAGHPRFFGGSIPWLKIGDLTRSTGGHVTTIKETVTEAGRERSVFLRAGTLVLSNSATVGIPGILDLDACIHDGFLAFLDLSADVDIEWLRAALETCRPQIMALAPEGTQKNLNTGIVKNIEMCIPPLDEQRDFVTALGKLVRARTVMTTAGTAGEALFNSLQTRAFRGEL